MENASKFVSRCRVVATRALPLTDDEDEQLCGALGGLYDMFDGNGNGVVDFTGLSSGLSDLCGVTRDERASAAFALYDYNDDGFITEDEMVRYLTSVFKAVYQAEPETEEQMGCSAKSWSRSRQSMLKEVGTRPVSLASWQRCWSRRWD